MLVFAATAPPKGYFLDKYGPCVVFSVGAALLGTGLFLSSRAQSIEQLILAYGVIAGRGPMAGNITS